MHHSSEAEIRRRFRLDSGTALIKASDAHSLEDIGAGCTWFELNDLSFDEIKKALLGLDGRKTTVE